MPQVNPHPGTEYYVAEFKKAITPRTRVVGLTHVSSNSGDVFPVAELCALARENGVLSLVDGAQSFGVLDVDLSAIHARLLHRLRAQMAVRSERDGRALRHARGARSDLAERDQPVRGNDRHLAEARGERPARRRGARGIRRRAQVQQSDRPPRDREALARNSRST